MPSASAAEPDGAHLPKPEPFPASPSAAAAAAREISSESERPVSGSGGSSARRPSGRAVDGIGVRSGTGSRSRSKSQSGTAAALQESGTLEFDLHEKAWKGAPVSGSSSRGAKEGRLSKLGGDSIEDLAAQLEITAHAELGGGHA